MRRGTPWTTDRSAAVRQGWLIGAALVATIAGIGTSAAPAEAATYYSCVPAATERLKLLNVEPSDVTQIFCAREIRRGRRGRRVTGIKAWISLKSCKGNVVINMSRHGQIRDVYGRGECDLGGAVKIW